MVKQSLYLDSRNIKSGTLSHALFDINPYINNGVKSFYVNKIFVDSIQNINLNNNTSQIIFNGVLYNISLNPGYYSPTSIITPLENAINVIPGLSVTITFNTVTNTYTFTFSQNVILPFGNGLTQFLFKTLQLQNFNSAPTNIFTSSPLPMINNVPVLYYSRTLKICSNFLGQFNYNQINASVVNGLFSVYNSPAYPSNCIETVFIRDPYSCIEYEPYSHEKFDFSKNQSTTTIDLQLFNDRNQNYFPNNIGTYRIELILCYD